MQQVVLPKILHPVKHRNEKLGTSARPFAEPDLAWRLNSATVHLNRALRDGRGIGLAAEHRSALSVVAFMAPIAIGELARSERVGAPAMTKTVKILEAAGLVRREQDPADGRRVRVRATPAGAAMIRRGRDERVAKIRQAIRSLGSADVRALAKGLPAVERVVAGIEASGPRRSSRNPRAAAGGRTGNTAR